MKTLEFNTNQRFLHWDGLIAQANAGFKTELAITYEALRELARNQRVVASRQNQLGAGDDDTYCDIIEPGKVTTNKVKITTVSGDQVDGLAVESHPSFGVVMRVQTDDTGEAPVLEYGHIRFTRLTPGQPVQKSNLEPEGENKPSTDRQILDGISSSMVGNDNLSFMYTPYIMMITRLLSVDLINVYLTVDEQEQSVTIQAVAGEYLVDTAFDMGKVREYFNL